MMLRADNLPSMVCCYLKLKPSVLKGEDKIRGLLVTVSSSRTVNVSRNVDITMLLKKWRHSHMYLTAGCRLRLCVFVLKIVLAL